MDTIFGGGGNDFLEAPLFGAATGNPLGAITGPLATGFGSGLSGVFSRPGASSAAISGGNPISSDRTMVNIAPVGVNVGEIFRNLEGPPENGGLGLVRRNRFLADSADTRLIAGSLPLGLEGGVSANVPTLLLIAAGAGLLIFVVSRARRR